MRLGRRGRGFWRRILEGVGRGGLDGRGIGVWERGWGRGVEEGGRRGEKRRMKQGERGR